MTSTEPARARHSTRALLETSALMLGGAVWYWRNLDFNARDWDLTWNADSWRRKLTFQAFRFDQNLFDTNSIRHGLAGVVHYQVARGNGFGVAGSIATALATSLFWEYTVEFKEYPSANDVMTNTIAGLAVGEPLYRLGQLLVSERRSPLARSLAAVVSPVTAFNDWVDGRRSYPSVAPPWCKRFSLTAALTRRPDRPGEGVTEPMGFAGALDADLVTVPGYQRPGRVARNIKPGSWSALHLRGEVGLEGWQSFNLRSRTALLGRYRQNLIPDGPGALAGSSSFLGLGSALEYDTRVAASVKDYMAGLDLLGPVFQLTTRRRGLAFRWTGELYPAFAMVKALAFTGLVAPIHEGVFRPGEHGGRIAGVLGARGYYYGLGVAGGTRAELQVHRWDLGAELRADDYHSISGHDRFQEEVRQDEYRLTDQTQEARVWLGVRPWQTDARLSAGVSWRRREGQAEELSASYQDRRLEAGLSLLF